MSGVEPDSNQAMPPPSPLPPPAQPATATGAAFEQPPVVGPADRSANGTRVGPVLTLLGGALAAIGPFVAWVTLDGSAAGDNADGFDTYFFGTQPDVTEWSSPGAYLVGLGVVMLVVGARALIGRPSRSLSIAGIVLGAVTCIVATAAWWAVRNVVDQAAAFGDFSTGWGVWISIVGAFGSLAGAIESARRTD